MAFAAILAAAYGLLINVLAFALFGIDKRRAVAGQWRIREATLIGVALAGGWLGAKAGQRRFRHKTRKQPFAGRLNAVGLLSLGLLIVLGAAIPFSQIEGAAEAGGLADAVGRIMPARGEEAFWSRPEPPARALPRRFGPGSGDGM